MNASFRNVIVVVACLVTACSSSESPEGTTGDDQNQTAAVQRIGGFDFNGPAIAAPPSAGVVCPEVVSPEMVACKSVGGVLSAAADCGALCSRPIARPGKVAGFDETGYRQLNALRENEACAQVLTPFMARCEEASGAVVYAEGCAVLCSVPVAPEGKVAGFAQGTTVQIVDGLGEGIVCAQSFTPFMVKCMEAKGTTSRYTKDCDVLCSVPIP